MSTTTQNTAQPDTSFPRVAASAATGSGLSFFGVLRSEWIKLRSLRSTLWSFALVLLISLGMSAVMANAAQPGPGFVIAEADYGSFILSASTFGIFFTQLIVAVLGVIVITGEYGTGMIKSTLTAVPRRLPALAAKAIVLFVATFVVGVVSTVGSFAVAAPIFARIGVTASLFDPAMLQGLIGGALYLALVSVFALGVGATLRSSAGGIAIVLGVLLALPVVLATIPAEWGPAIAPYLLSNAGTEFFIPSGMSVLQGSWPNLLVAIAWGVVSLIVASVLLKKRDA
jgi:ABC-2 type transport system permease protein